MISIKDIMLLHSPFLTNTDTVDQARVIASHCKFNSIPVVKTNGEFVGILDKNLIFQDRIQVESTVNNYLDTSINAIYSDEFLSVLAKISIPPEVSILPVLNRKGRLIGVIPNPQFLQDIYSEIIGSLNSLFADGELKLTKYGMIIIDNEGKIVCFNENSENILGIRGTNTYGVHINKILHDSGLSEVLQKRP